MDTAPSATVAACVGCGGYPVNHASTYFANTLSMREHDLAARYDNWPVFHAVSDMLRTAAFYAEPVVIHMLHMVSGARVIATPGPATMDRARAIWDEAVRRGIRMEQVVIFGVPLDSYRAVITGRPIYFESLPVPSRLRALTFPWADDKLLFKQFLIRHGIPAAAGATASTIPAAHESLKALRLPVVVKPRLGSNSRHTTPLVQTIEQFDTAFALSQQLGREVLFEEYLPGNLCRATVVDGKLAGFLESRQPVVVGDGIRTVLELIAEKNEQKVARVGDIVIDEDSTGHIRRQGYEPESILPPGVAIRVTRLPGRSSGGENREMLAQVHPKLRGIVEQVAQLLKAPLVGFDLIVDDPRADPDAQQWGILEANTVPFIEIHSDPLYGEPSNVAAAVWDLWK